MTPGFTIPAVMVLFLLSFKIGSPMPLATGACPLTFEALRTLTMPPCSLSGKNRSTAVCLRIKMYSGPKFELRLNVTVDGESAYGTSTISFLNNNVPVRNTVEVRTKPCISTRHISEDYSQPPTWRVHVKLEEPTRGLVVLKNLTSRSTVYCLCEPVVVPFNVLAFSCSGGRETWTWTTTSVTAGYTCAKKR